MRYHRTFTDTMSRATGGGSRLEKNWILDHHAPSLLGEEAAEHQLDTDRCIPYVRLLSGGTIDARMACNPLSSVLSTS